MPIEIDMTLLDGYWTLANSAWTILLYSILTAPHLRHSEWREGVGRGGTAKAVRRGMAPVRKAS